jgi:hypothetical protein
LKAAAHGLVVKLTQHVLRYLIVVVGNNCLDPVGQGAIAEYVKDRFDLRAGQSATGQDVTNRALDTRTAGV